MKKTQPASCPACNSIPIVTCKVYNSYSKEYRCYCKTCLDKVLSTSDHTKLEDDFSYGATSQHSAQAAIHNWNLKVYRRSAKLLKQSLAPPKVVDVVELLKNKNACQQQIDNVECMLKYWDVCKEYLENKSSYDEEAARIFKLISG